MTAFAGCIALLAFWILWYFAVQPLACDIFRQKLFNLRAELFDYAASGAIDFNSPAYYRLRMRINALIFRAERITLPRSLALLAKWESLGLVDSGEFEQALVNVPVPVAERLRAFQLRALSLVSLRLFLIPALALLPISVPLYFLDRRLLRKKAKEQAAIIEVEATCEYRQARTVA